MTTTGTAPMTTDVLAVHVDYLRADVQKVLTEMATKSDVDKIAKRMDQFVTTDRFDALEKKVDAGSIGSSLDRGLSLAIKLSSAIAAIIAMIGVIVAVVHFFDALKGAL